SVDLLARTAFALSFALNERLTWYAVPSGPNDTHGSDERSYPPPFCGVPPAHVLKCGNVRVHEAPPLCVTAVTSPCAPPSDQRSCCQTAIRLFAFVGLTSAQGSSSAFGYSTLPGAWPTVHAANGLGPDTVVSGDTVNTPALPPADTTPAATSA